MRTARSRCALVVALCAAWSASAQAGPRLLDVPFVPQSEELCGGAAVAMVMRYWEATGVHAEDFAALVDRSAGGISVGALVRAVRARGWDAHAFAATAGDVQSHLARGRPAIALIEDRPGRLHYVVVVAWTAERVVYHDPAANPFRTLDPAAFDRAWRATDRTALLVLPQAASAPASGPVEPSTCPRCANRARSDAGALFLDRRYGDAASLAQIAVDQDPADADAWQLLAAARYLEGDAAGALDAWNRRQEPRVDLARVDGLSRSRHGVIAGALDLPPQTLLTRAALARAARRVADIPALQLSRVGYSPRENGTATVDVSVAERPLMPASRAALIAAGLHAATMREARLHVASPSGSGELWTASARWWNGRPRAALSLAFPALAGLRGRWQVEGAWERQTYSVASGRLQSDRRHAAVSVGDWASSRVRYRLGAAVDRWNGGATHASVTGALERRLFDDRLALGVESQAAARFATASASARWRSGLEALSGWHGTAGVAAVTRRAPFDLWPGGDTGVARSTLLRAHPLLEDGAVRASALRRVLPHGSLEYQRRLADHPMLRVGWAAFVDAAAPHVDAGAGLRFKLPSAPGVLRVDVARGVTDGAMALSLSWQPAW